MAYIGSQEDIGFVSGITSSQDATSWSSYLLSPRRSVQTDCLTSALEKAFGHRRGLLRRLMSLEVPDKAYVWSYVLQMRRRGFKLLTIHQSLTTLRRFLVFLGDMGKARVEEVRRSDLEAFVEHEQDRGLKLSTVRTAVARVYAFLSFLVEEELIRPDILMRKVKLRLPEHLPRAMDPDDVVRLVCVIDEVRDRALVLVLLRTGMRIGELLTTRPSDLNMDEQTITIFEGRKNRRGRVVYFSDDAREALRAWLSKRDPMAPFLFHSRARGRLSYTSASMMFKRYLQAAGLAHRGYSLHSLRHTYASELLNGGMRLVSLQELMGHDSIEVTRRYGRLTNKTRRQEYFRAMAIIERGQIHGSYRDDRELQTILKEKEPLTPYHQKLYDKP
jgi:integrase/recombinase XerD